MAIQPEEVDEFNAMDGIWSVGINGYLQSPIPIATIPLILKIQYDEKMANGMMTIREAQWVSNLSSLFLSPMLNLDFIQRETRTMDLWIIAQLYAAFDRACRSACMRCDTSVLDHSNPEILKLKVLLWFKGKIYDELYQKLWTSIDGLTEEKRRVLQSVHAYGKWIRENTRLKVVIDEETGEFKSVDAVEEKQDNNIQELGKVSGTDALVAESHVFWQSKRGNTQSEMVVDEETGAVISENSVEEKPSNAAQEPKIIKKTGES